MWRECSYNWEKEVDYTGFMYNWSVHSYILRHKGGNCRHITNLKHAASIVDAGNWHRITDTRMGSVVLRKRGKLCHAMNITIGSRELLKQKHAIFFPLKNIFMSIFSSWSWAREMAGTVLPNRPLILSYLIDISVPNG